MSTPGPHQYTDQTGRVIKIKTPARRIVSVVPSQTELLEALGLEEEVVGITKFCIHPERWFRSKQRIGGTKTLHVDHILELEPDLVIANKEENEKEQILELAGQIPVWISNVNSLKEAYDMILSVGELTATQPLAQNLVFEIKQQFNTLQRLREQRSVAYLIWNDPLMVAGGSTFIDKMLDLCGLENIFRNAQGRYPEVSHEELKGKAPDLIFLSSEPFPFGKKHAAKFETLFPDSRVMLVDGELFSWYGSRLKHAPVYLNGLLNSIEKEKI